MGREGCFIAVQKFKCAYMVHLEAAEVNCERVISYLSALCLPATIESVIMGLSSANSSCATGSALSCVSRGAGGALPEEGISSKSCAPPGRLLQHEMATST